MALTHSVNCELPHRPSLCVTNVADYSIHGSRDSIEVGIVDRGSTDAPYRLDLIIGDFAEQVTFEHDELRPCHETIDRDVMPAVQRFLAGLSCKFPLDVARSVCIIALARNTRVTAVVWAEEGCVRSEICWSPQP